MLFLFVVFLSDEINLLLHETNNSHNKLFLFLVQSEKYVNIHKSSIKVQTDLGSAEFYFVLWVLIMV